MTEEFINWLDSNGAKFPKLKIIKTNDSYRSVYTVDFIERGELICYIPKKCIITKEYSEGCKLVKYLKEKGYSFNNEHDLLAICLLYEKSLGKSSFFYHYINILPKTFPTNPIFFNSEDLEKLKGSGAYDKVLDKLTELKLSFEFIKRADPSSDITFEEYIWARTIVITRVFGFNVAGCVENGLVPFADLLNHNHPSEVNTSWNYNDKLNGFVITNTSKVKNGVEIYDTYGKKCNYRFFVNYGFFLDCKQIREDEEIVLEVNNKKYQILFKLKPHLEKDRYGGMITLGELIREFRNTMSLDQALQCIQEACEQKLMELPNISLPQNERERIIKNISNAERLLVNDILYFTKFCLDLSEKISIAPSNKKSLAKKAKTKCRSFYIHEIDYFIDKNFIK